MQVYKVFFRIIFKNIPQMMMYVTIFLVFGILLANVFTTPVNANYGDVKIKTAFINHDGNSILMEGFKSYLTKNAILVDIDDNTKKLQDALFFRRVEYVVKVPAGFTDALLSGRAPELQRIKLPNSTSSFYMDNLINKYLNTVKTYSRDMKNLNQDQLVSYVSKDLSLKTDVTVKSSGHQDRNAEKINYYFNYLCYSLFAILILGVCSVMMVLNDTDLKMRSQCSPMKLSNQNIQLIAGILSFSVITWFLLILPSLIMYGNYMFTKNGLMLLLSSFVFNLTALSISFLFGNIIKSKSAMSAAANAVSLGIAFLGGAFVPQAMLGKTALKIATFIPSYWYVKANNDIVNNINLGLSNLGTIFSSILVMLGFTAAVLAITLVLIKQKRITT